MFFGVFYVSSACSVFYWCILCTMYVSEAIDRDVFDLASSVNKFEPLIIVYVSLC